MVHRSCSRSRAPSSSAAARRSGSARAPSTGRCSSALEVVEAARHRPATLRFCQRCAVGALCFSRARGQQNGAFLILHLWPAISVSKGLAYLAWQKKSNMGSSPSPRPRATFGADCAEAPKPGSSAQREAAQAGQEDAKKSGAEAEEAKAAKAAEAKKAARRQGGEKRDEASDSDEDRRGQRRRGRGRGFEPEENDDDVAEDVHRRARPRRRSRRSARSWPSRKAKTRGYRTWPRRPATRRTTTRATRTSTWRAPSCRRPRSSRACKWAPQLADKAAYDGLTEFEERTQLSLASLPPSAARVIRAHGETYLRRLVNGAFQRASDQQKTGVTDPAGRGRDAPAPARAEVLVRRAQGPDPLLAGLTPSSSASSARPRTRPRRRCARRRRSSRSRRALVPKLKKEKPKKMPRRLRSGRRSAAAAAANAGAA